VVCAFCMGLCFLVSIPSISNDCVCCFTCVRVQCVCRVCAVCAPCVRRVCDGAGAGAGAVVGVRDGVRYRHLAIYIVCV
jgi:hypothetical protein